jgi:hypothetical protein
LELITLIILEKEEEKHSSSISAAPYSPTALYQVGIVQLSKAIGSQTLV